MGIELVNGRAGEPHVSGEDVGRLYRGIAGDGAYYLGGTAPSLSMATANRLSMGPCDLLLAGMHATLDGVDEWTIENGSQGMKRHDLCVLRYSRDASTGVEELRPATVKGSATDGTPVDPSHAKGSRADGSQMFDVPVARVELDGLTPGEPQLLVQKLGTLSSLWDSVSRRETGKVESRFNLTSSKLELVGALAVLELDALALQTALETWGTVVATLPDGFRPAVRTKLSCSVHTKAWESMAPGEAWVDPSGEVTVSYKVGFSPYDILVGGCYPVAP